MAAVAAAIAASLSSLSLFTTSSAALRRRAAAARAFSSSSTFPAAAEPREFNITFGTGRSGDDPPESPEAAEEGGPAPLLIPWILRDGNGGFRLSSAPPAGFIREMVQEKMVERTARKKKKGEERGGAEPKHSKAARRFYNDNFREAQRLSKVLAGAGVASRRSSEELIFDGKVTVNGSVCRSPQTRVDLHRDIIYVNGNRLSKKLPPKLYFALNKPKGYICSSGKEDFKSAIYLLDEYWKSWNKANPGLPKPRLFTVGRLDVATTGLIIVTNDGDFAQKLSHPSSGLTKEYIATIDGDVNKRQLVAMSEGADIDGVLCVPESVELLPPQPDISRPRVRIVVNEGRNHEVREIVKNAGLQIHSLKRVRIGGFRIPSDLGLGQYVELKQAQLKSFGGNIAKGS